MTLLSRLRFWLLAIPGRSRVEREMDSELHFHVEARANDLVRGGVPPEEAVRRAQIEFGGIERAKEECRDARGVNLVESLIKDFRFGTRMLRKSPGFSAAAILTLGLGIGANTSILAVMHAVLQPKLPYSHPDRLVSIYNRNLKEVWETREFVSIPFWRDCREQNHTLEDVAAFTATIGLNLKSTRGGAARIRAVRISTNFFSVIGREPILGRGLTEEESRQSGDHVAVLSDRLWKEHFGRRADVIGQVFFLDREKYSVIGVLPADFQAATLKDRPDLFLPLETTGADARRRDLRPVDLIARLKRGITPAVARVDLSQIAKELAKAFPATDGNWDASVIELRPRPRSLWGFSITDFPGAGRSYSAYRVSERLAAVPWSSRESSAGNPGPAGSWRNALADQTAMVL